MKRFFMCLVAAVYIFIICGAFAYAEDPGKSHCSDKTLQCVKDHGKGKPEGHVKMGQCWYWFLPGCDDCKGTDYAKYTNECNSTYSECKGTCWACDTKYSRGSGLLNCYDHDGNGHVVGSE